MIFPEDASLHGHLFDGVFWLGLWLVSIAFLLVVGTMAVFLIRYRARPGHAAVPARGDTKGARRLTVSLALLVFFGIDVNLFYFDHHARQVVMGTPPPRDQAVVVQVIAKQFEWRFRLAGTDGTFGTEDDVTTTNKLKLPLNRPVVCDLRSMETIHSFFLPNFRIKQDVLPGMQTSIYFTPVKEGKFEVACAELCGLGHYRMRGRIYVVSDEAFEDWKRQTVEDFGADLEPWKLYDEEEGA